IFTPKPPAPNAEPRFSINLLFDAKAQKTPEFAALRKAAMEAIEAKWPGKSKDKAFVAKLASPFKPCSEKDYAGYDIKDGVFITPWSKFRPGVVDKNMQPVLEPREVYAGQLIRASVTPFAYEV